MLINDLKADFQKILNVNNLKLVDASKKTGKPSPFLSRFTAHQNILPSFIEIYDKLGYDIEITYVKKRK